MGRRVVLGGGRSIVALFGRWFVAVLVAAAPYLPAVAVPGSWLGCGCRCVVLVWIGRCGLVAVGAL
ncbi:MAG: hypothetical protein K6F40_00815 [Bacteroidales bacterium]|nr:hypothetical protein [Bacteroidales bacterium]